MGILDTIDSLELSDEQKNQLRLEYAKDVDPIKARAQQAERDNKRDKVEEEVSRIGAMFSDEQGNVLPDALSAVKFARRVFLSDTGADPSQEPEAVLLADHELGLSGDKASGAHSQEGITAAGALRKFIELLPTEEKDGKVRLMLSDQSLSSDDHSRTGGGGATEDETDKDGHRKSLSAATGLPEPQRTRKRYSGGRPVATGGAS